MNNDKISTLYFECTDLLYGYWKVWARWYYETFVRGMMKK